MIKRLAIIPARSGSKGLRNKNVLMLMGKPLIAYSIEAAFNSGVFSRVVVSTDSIEYKCIAEKYGAEVVMRNEELATDTATSFMVVEDVLKKYNNFDYFVLLQPTSPFRNATHIQDAIDLFDSTIDVNFLVSVTKSDKTAVLINPLDSLNRLSAFKQNFSNYRRQINEEYYPNGAIFIGRYKEYLEKKHFFGSDSIAYIMEKEDSIDIDDWVDFEFAISLANKKTKKDKLIKEIKTRISEKFSKPQTKYPITLIGHSIFDYWNISELKGHKVVNYGIAGINSEQYYTLVLKENLISTLGDNVILLTGTNDIVDKTWHVDYTIYWTKKIIETLRKINSRVCIYVVSVPPVWGRIDRDNSTISLLNAALKTAISNMKNVIWVPLSDKFYDAFGNLPSYFTYDGLHFTDTAYEQLEKELSRSIK
ncbi:acylneuraminate cytidylyltransferase [Escherichia albertii]|uniref:Predicted N-acylneuraminate cytidylyltrtansferase n=1 Tax=Escherichia albertii TaxID=208962 RepID=A0A5A4U545_ESCAL|nr:GDSL-type esterase/lipase family protein [Escherichia albertii]MCZ8641291.1 GDSL-type esterase/lipase family protein [Escherichia albertii]MCZ9211460.1 GDSL-type esterase/lipase family protein [Escherichia albertii]QSZ84900.1 acylneuraminate cytidylyltransferase [Escherichia albertii]QSZ89281.1 acylneuraminate cytidylyltransferase [Escherichia albertii]QSZ93669.1 acylneuraminate cytidylyltransferase [Escherichia albertii]